MKTLPLFLAALLAVPLFAAEKPANLTLNDGVVLKAARIVAIGKEQVTIVHEGGAHSTQTDNVPLDVLARAHMALEAGDEERKQQREVALKRAAESDEDKRDEINARLAMAKVRAAEEAAKPPGVRRAIANIEHGLAALKARFPAAEKRKVSVKINNPRGNSRQSAAVHGRPYRYDTIEVQVPSPDLHSKYRGWVMAASAASLPSIVEKLDSQLAADLSGTMPIATENQSAAAQARYSREWLSGVMRPYIAQMRALHAAR